MRLKYLLSAALGGAFTVAAAAPALAGSNCGTVAGDRCNPGYVYSQSPVMTSPVSTHYGQPYDHLRRAEYVQTPQINVTRIETGRRLASLSDAPSHSWAGCGGASAVTCAAPAPAPIMARPMPMAAPVVMAPAPAPVMRSYSASHSYDASKFQSRQYGTTDFVPGIAHIPTSIVDRSVANRDAILASGTVVAQPVLHTNSSYSTVSTASTSNTVAYNADGTSWSKASGPTFVDGMYASEVLCKQPAPMQQRIQVHQQAYQVVRPVVNVPYPVPVAVPGPTVNVRGGDSRYGSRHAQNNCAAPAPRPMVAPAPIMRRIAPGHATQAPRGGGRYGASTWTY